MPHHARFACLGLEVMLCTNEATRKSVAEEPVWARLACVPQVDYTEDPGTMYFFRYPVADSEEHLPVATTRPETILGDTAVAVHPEAGSMLLVLGFRVNAYPL